MQIRDSVAIVTGGNRGIGESFVRELVAAGARRVYVGSREAAKAGHLAEAHPDVVQPVTLDVTQLDQVEAAAAACPDVTILVNNAGAFANETLLSAPDLSAARLEMEVNYFGTLSMCRAFAPILGRNGGGAIVNVLSVAAIIAAPIMGGYSPSKFAALAATTNIRAELMGQGTQVSALIVGSVDTRMAADVKGYKEPPDVIAKAGLLAVAKNIPEMDTDDFAVRARASLHRDPAALERRMAAALKLGELSTGA